MNARNAIGLVLGFLLAGCADSAIVGEWVGGNEQVSVELSIETDLTGRANVLVGEDGGIKCLYSVEVEEEGAERYKMRMADIGSEDCGGSLEAGCTLDGDELDCDEVSNGGLPLMLVRK